MAYPHSNHLGLNIELNKAREGSVDILLKLMFDRNYSNYESFSNKSHEVGKSDLGSMESLHDNYHGLLGGSLFTGHMGRVPVAAFDPVFWLHHW